MKYILSIKDAFWPNTSLVLELTEEDVLRPVSVWLDAVLCQERSVQAMSMRMILADGSSGLFARSRGGFVPVDISKSALTYADADSEDPTADIASVAFVTSTSLGSSPIVTGRPNLFGTLDLPESTIESDIPPNFEDRLALILGGGGAKGAAQAGAIKAVRDLLETINALVNVGAQVHYVVGSSIGALNALFVSSGKIDALEAFWSGVHPLSGLRLVRDARRHIAAEDLQIPMEVSAVNLQTGQAEFVGLESPDIFAEVQKSMRLPPLLPAVRSRGAQYVDGGVLVNLPVSRCLDMHCYWIIVLGLEVASDSHRRYCWPLGQGRRALDLQGRELQRFQRLFLWAGGQLKRLAEIADVSQCSIEDLMFLGDIKRRFFTANVIVVPLEKCITASSLWFSRRRCRSDFRNAYESTYQFLGDRLLPIAQQFAKRTGQ